MGDSCDGKNREGDGCYGSNCNSSYRYDDAGDCVGVAGGW